jgi:hypothetical protein
MANYTNGMLNVQNVQNVYKNNMNSTLHLQK